VAIALAIDMKGYDSLQTINALHEGVIDDLHRTVNEKDGQIKDCQDSRNRLGLVISNYQAQQATDKDRQGALEKLYKKQVRAGRFKIVIIGGLAALTAYKLLK